MGIDNVGVIALTSLLDPTLVISDTKFVECPLIILESKVDYGKFLWNETASHSVSREKKLFGALKLSPTYSAPTITIVSYGETARHIADNLDLFFVETDYVVELICLTQLHPLDLNLILRSINRTRKILIVEDGSISFGLGSEILSILVENKVQLDFAMRVGAEAVPVPSVVNLEIEILPTINRIIKLINSKTNRGTQ